MTYLTTYRPATINQTIVLVDDDDVYLAMVQDLLAEEGYTRVLRVLRDDAAETIGRERPGLVLLDVHIRSDGWRLLSRLRHDPLTAGTPILICTTNPRMVEAQAGHLLNDSCTILAKPFDLEEFLASVRARVGPPARYSCEQ